MLVPMLSKLRDAVADDDASTQNMECLDRTFRQYSSASCVLPWAWKMDQCLRSKSLSRQIQGRLTTHSDKDNYRCSTTLSTLYFFVLEA